VYQDVLCSLYVAADDGYDSSYTIIPVTIVYNPNAEPDIQLSRLSATPNPLKVRHSALVSFTTKATNNDFRFPYDVALTLDDSVFDVITFPALAHDLQDSDSISVRIDSLGRYQLKAELILPPGSIDSDTTNNSLELTIITAEGDVIIKPQPFTPNGDGKNDELLFDLTAFYLDDPRLMIFSLAGVKLTTLAARNNIIYWDGRDETGRELPPGVYMYAISDGKRKIKSGVVTLAR